ncbi:MAG TPA: hypothetical protein VIX82_05855 [Solirubrobacteraceae bacterium]
MGTVLLGRTPTIAQLIAGGHLDEPAMGRERDRQAAGTAAAGPSEPSLSPAAVHRPVMWAFLLCRLLVDPTKGQFMRKRLKTVLVAAAALAALALGGSALATAASSTSPKEKVSATDPGPAVQQGDQTSPDVGAAASRKAAEAQPTNDPAGANDTTSPDTRGATSENAPENASENAPSDGPGGYSDTAGTNADTQQQGEH